jgi:integrase
MACGTTIGSVIRETRLAPWANTPAEFARLLESASDETLPYWALGGFTGLRTAELERLGWAEVHFDF